MNDTARNLIESVLGDVIWPSSEAGYTFCPGGETHKNGVNIQNALVRFNAEGVPHVFCFHESCRARQNQANAELQSLFNSHGLAEKKPKSENQKAAEAKAKELRRVKWLARHRALPVLTQDPVPLDTWTSESPYPVADLSPAQQTRAFLSGLYRSLDTVWAGDPHESGPDHEFQFKTAQDWLTVRSYGQQISRSVFRHGVCDRTHENVLFHRFTVLESDVLSREQFGAVVRFAQKYSTLRSITDTGGKGFHAAFDYFYDLGLYAILEGLTCDHGMLRYSLTTRLPGATRKNKNGTPGKIQTLLYLNPVNEIIL